MVNDTMTLFSPERTLFVQELESKKRVFDTLATLLSYKQTLSQDQIFDHLIQREKLGSTTLGGGIALPRARAPIHQPYAALLLLNEGIQIDSPDKQAITVFVALMLPETSPHTYSDMIAQLMQSLATRPVAAELAETSEPEIAINYMETLLQQTKAL
ncbi:MAG: PTS sugar transporter subunit IIA [Leucothrix sp.]